MNDEITKAYDFTGRSIIITGGAGILCSEMARALVDCGANVAILDYNLEAAERLAAELESLGGAGKVLAVKAVLKPLVEAAVDAVWRSWPDRR